MAIRSPRLPATACGSGRNPHLRRPARPASRRDEPRGCPALDPLAWPGDPGIARGGKRILHGVPVHVTEESGPTMAAVAVSLAAQAPQQVDRGVPSRDIPLGV